MQKLDKTMGSSSMSPVKFNYRLLATLSRVTYSPLDVEVAHKLLSSPEFDEGLFLSSVLKQKVAGLVAYNVNRWDLNCLSPWLKMALKLFYLANQERNKRILEILKAIVSIFEQNNIDARPLKGAILLQSTYRDGGSRVLYDIDFFIAKLEMPRVEEVLNSIGYLQGEYDRDSNAIVPIARKERLLWQIKMFEAYPFRALLGDPYLGFSHKGIFGIDFSYGLTFSDGEEVEKQVLSQHSNIGGYRTLSTIDFLIQLCCHLYKEASNEAWADIGLDINLIKFCDVREFGLSVLSEGLLSGFRDRVFALGAALPVYFALFYTFQIYGDPIFKLAAERCKHGIDDFSFMTDIYRQGIKSFSTRSFSIEDAIGGSGAASLKG